MLKNWTVTAQSTKSAAAREIYFHNKNDRSHKNTEAMIDIFGSPDTTINIIRNAEAHKLKTAMKRKGGRPPTEAMEFVFTLPKGPQFRPTKEQWQEITKRILLDMAKTLGVPPVAFKGIVRAVCHQQEQSLRESGNAGDHVHVMVGKFTNNGMYLRDLQKKGVIYAAKNSFNAAVYDTIGVDHKTYKAQKNLNAKKRAPLWKVRAARAHNTLDLKNKLLDQREFDIDEKTKQLKELQSLTVKFQNQAEKWLEAFDNADSRQMNRQANRMNKVIDELSLHKDTEEFEQVSKTISLFAQKVNKVAEDTIKPLKPVDKAPKPTLISTLKP